MSVSNDPFPFPTADRPGVPSQSPRPVTQQPSEDALDAGVEESFPASDPVSVTVSRTEVASAPQEPAGAQREGQTPPAPGTETDGSAAPVSSAPAFMQEEDIPLDGPDPAGAEMIKTVSNDRLTPGAQPDGAES